MTNEYGSDAPPAQDHENEHASGQETHAPDVEAGVWSDDQPPHDDFGGAAEEAPSVSQEAAADVETDETTGSETRQSRSMLPVLAGIGGILLLGALIYWQFGRSTSSSKPPSMVAAMSAQKPSPAPTAPTIPPAQPDSASTKSAVPDINALYKPTNGAPSQGAGPSPVATDAPTPTTAMASAPNAVAPIPVPPNPVSPIPATPSPIPMPPNFVPPSGNVPQAQPQTGQTENSRPLMMPGGEVQEIARLKALSARIDNLQQSVDQQTKQLGQVSNMIVAQAPPASPSQANPDLENRLNRIEQTLMKLESDEAAKGSPAPAVAPLIETPKLAVKTHSSKKISSRPRHTYKREKPVHHKSLSPKAPSDLEQAKSSWVLRAATPKEAWVSGDARSSELRHVQVGDTLPGIGTVRGINQTPHGWEIEGTAGVVR